VEAAAAAHEPVVAEEEADEGAEEDGVAVEEGEEALGFGLDEPGADGWGERISCVGLLEMVMGGVRWFDVPKPSMAQMIWPRRMLMILRSVRGDDGV